MDFKKLLPWNWFKDEERHSGGEVVPVEYEKLQRQHTRGDADPFRLFADMEKFFSSGLEENLWSSFNRNLPTTPLTDPGLLRPYIDIAANSSEYMITVEIPGVNEKDISLEISEDTLVIKGEKKQTHEERKRNFYRVERSYGSFQRLLSLPQDADREHIEAAFKNGVLNISIPRKELPATSEPRVVQIK